MLKTTRMLLSSGIIKLMTVTSTVAITTSMAFLTTNSVIAKTTQSDNRLEVVASSAKYAMNGVAVTETGRVFVSMPQWTSENSPSVGEVNSDGSVKPYPGSKWNEFDINDPMNRFVHVNSVHYDGAGSLWAVDYAAPRFGKVIKGAQKLVRIDLATNKVSRVYRFDDSILHGKSKLNDVRVDAKRGKAYLSEFGEGSIIVLDLKTGESFRALDQHYSTRLNPDVKANFLGKPMNTKFSHVNQIELSLDGETLFYQSPGGPILWKIPTKFLDKPRPNASIEPYVEVAVKSMVIGGITRDTQGDIYFGSIEDNAVWKFDVANGKNSQLITDERLLWPDAMSVGPNNYLYIPAPQLLLLPRFHKGESKIRGKFRVYRTKL